ncbi:Uncharacterized protein SCF082_LOCUS40216 [Durusdinium trenchii]|uniref:Uncharacterized protein n=1 Tax=Durusdinium trenchii TaxID=1381693 RepID=A0ABP0Q983_9DINO
MSAQFVDDCNSLLPENADGFVGSPPEPFPLMPVCPRSGCMHALPDAGLAVVKSLHDRFWFIVRHHAPRPKQVAKEVLVLSLRSESSNVSKDVAVVFHTRRAPWEAALLVLHRVHAPELAGEGIIFSLAFSAAAGQDAVAGNAPALDLTSDRVLFVELAQLASDWTFHFVDIGGVRALSRFNVTSVTAFEENAFQQKAQEASETAQALQALSHMLGTGKKRQASDQARAPLRIQACSAEVTSATANRQRRGESWGVFYLADQTVPSDLGCTSSAGAKWPISEGVYDFEAYEDAGVEERVIEDDGKQEIFAEEAFQAKKQAALDTLHKQAKDREATSVKAKENDMTFTDLVQVARSFGDRSSSSAAAAAETKTAEDEQAQAVEESSSSSTSSSSGDEAAVGLDLLSGAAPQKSNADHAEKPKAKPKPKAKDTAKTTKTASTAPKTGKASSQVTAAPSKSQGSSALAGESMGPGPGMLSLDGRASRTLKSLETAIEQAQESISKVNYDDQPLSTSQLKDFKAEATQRMAVLNSAAKKAKETLTRVGKSNNKDSFQIQMDKLQGLAALASAGSKLLAQVIAPTLDADAYISAHEEVASNGGKLGPLYWLKLVVANGQKELLYGKYSGFCEAFVLSKEQHDKPINKLETLMGKDEAAKRCAVEVENRMLASLRAIPASELALLGAGKTAADLGSEAPRLNESLDFAAAMLEACYEHSEEFMAAELKESVRTVQCFLGQDHVGALLEQVSALSSNRLVAMPALQRFFLQHDTGKSLFATAQLRVEHCDKEKEFQDKLDLLEKAVKHLAAWQKQSLPEAESGVAAVHKRIEPAVEALEVVKQTAFFADMKKKKQEHASNRLLPDLERLEEQLGLRSSEMVWLICKENMENHLNYFSNALEKECMVDLGHGKSGLINLDEILLSFKATAFVSLKVWDKLPSAAAAVKQYKEASELAANVAQYVFQKHAAFSQMPSGGKAVEPETLHKWKVSGFTLVQPYVPEEVAKRFETMFVAVVEAELATVFSKGLDSVAPIVSKCVKGLLGAGLSRQIREETMQRIPASHRLKDLVDLFADCRASWLVHRPTSYVPTFPCLAGFLAEASTALGAGAKQVSACRLACRAWPSWLQ